MKTVLAAIALLSAAVVSPLLGQGDDESIRKSLAGLRGVWVQVTKISDEAQRDGLGQEQIQTDIELKLRQAGITVLSREQWLAVPGAPVLDVSVNAFKHSEGAIYGFSVMMQLEQWVRLGRNPSNASLLAPTWSVGPFTGMSGTLYFGAYVRERVRDQTDQFINAYLTANPKR